MQDDNQDQSEYADQLNLDLRGLRFAIQRHVMMGLPESILLCLFPNGLVMAKQPRQYQEKEKGDEDEEDEEEVYIVDFDPSCLRYVLDFFKAAQDSFYGTATRAGRFRGGVGDFGGNDPSGLGMGVPVQMGPASQTPLLSKQAVIVLREELEYFAIPPTTDKASRHPDENTDENGVPSPALCALKLSCGEALLERRHVFTALQRNVNKENNMAEQHLIDMLCMSGFDRSDVWGFRAMEPSRCCITSIGLVLLKTGIFHAGDARPEDPSIAWENGPNGMVIDPQQLATAQKLLLFWRKPARKCWWDGVDVVIPRTGTWTETTKEGTAADDSDEGTPGAGMSAREKQTLAAGNGRKIRVWARRVWTLELSLI